MILLGGKSVILLKKIAKINTHIYTNNLKKKKN